MIYLKHSLVIVFCLTTVMAFGQKQYNDTIMLKSGHKQAVMIDKINTKKNSIEFYTADDPSKQRVRMKAVESYVLASDLKFEDALEYFNQGSTAWRYDGSVIDNKADLESLESLVDEWLDTPGTYSHYAEVDHDDQVGVLRGDGEVQLNASVKLLYSIRFETFGHSYNYSFTDLRLSSDDALQSYITESCFDSSGNKRETIHEFNKRVISMSADAMSELISSLEMIMGAE